MEQNTELFERMPVPRAVASLAVPTIISQLIVMVYNLADTFFIGQTNDPDKVAAASLAYVLFFMLNAVANLFGIGGGSLISRLLGADKKNDAASVCSFSFYGTIAVTLIYCICCYVFMEPLLYAIGASINTIEYAYSYTFWVVVIGGIPSALAMTLSHILRSEGHGKKAGFGLSMGGILNAVLDPLFMFVIFPDGLEITGAAAATCLSNICALIYYLAAFEKIKKNSVLSLKLSDALKCGKQTAEIFAVGFPSAVSSVLVCAAIMLTNRLASGYGDIPVAAIGIVKKMEMLPHNVGTGLCQGMIPLVAYNYASGDHQRMHHAVRFTRNAGLVITGLCIILFETAANGLSWLFIRDPDTLAMTAVFLRIMVLATPFTVCNFHMTYTLQALGKGRESMILACCRQGLILIPLLLIMNSVCGLYGVIWTQLIADAITAAISLFLFRKVSRSLA